MKHRKWNKLFWTVSLAFLLPVQELIAQYPGKNPYQHLMEGAIDMHCHSAPDAFDRSVNDWELATLAEQDGMKAVVIKNHVSSTAGRAELVNSQFDNFKIYGSVTLNKGVGGINPHAVSWMCRISPNYGKIVWFPTFDAHHHKQQFKLTDEGITILDNGDLTPETLEVLQIITENDLVLATGHLAPNEVNALVSRAKDMGVKKIVITHAMNEAPGMNTNQMKALAKMGAFIELTYLSYLSGPQAPLGFLKQSNHVSIADMVKVINSIGANNIILSTDLGQSGNPTPSDGLKNFIGLLIENGISENDIQKMIKQNPYYLLGLASED